MGEGGHSTVPDDEAEKEKKKVGEPKRRRGDGDTSGGFTDTETLLQPLAAPAASAPITASPHNFRLEPAKSQQSSAEDRRRDLSGP